MRVGKLLVLPLLLCLFSCGSEGNKDDVPAYPLKHIVLSGDDVIIGKVRNMTLAAHSVPVIVDAQADSLFRKLDYTRSRVEDMGCRGQGPNEFLFPTALVRWEGDSIGCWDINRRRYSVIRFAAGDAPSSVWHVFVAQDSLFHYEIYPVCHNHFVAAGIYEDARFAVLDKDGRLLAKIGVPPYRDEDERKVSGIIRSEVYQGRLAVAPSGTRMVHALLHADGIAFYAVDSCGNLRLVKERIKSYPDYRKTDGAIKFSAPFYYIDAFATERYVYALYSGKSGEEGKANASLGQEVHVYDWEGHPVKKYGLDTGVQKLCVSPDDKRIFAIAFTPNPTLVAFDL